MYGGRVIDDFDRRITRTYMNEYMGDFLFDTFQPFHFYMDEHTDYCLPEEETVLKEDFIGTNVSVYTNFDLKSFVYSHIYIYIFFYRLTEHIDKLPLVNKPDVFGLHPNAEIGYYTLATRSIWNSLIELQPQTGKMPSHTHLYKYI